MAVLSAPSTLSSSRIAQDQLEQDLKTYEQKAELHLLHLESKAKPIGEKGKERENNNVEGEGVEGLLALL